MVIGLLTNRDVDKLERAIRSTHTYTTFIVCNTMDDQYAEQVKSLAWDYDLPYYRTECNGNPGKGKNSVIDIFLRVYNSDYLLPMDADDYYTHDFPDIIEAKKLADYRIDILAQSDNEMTCNGITTTWDEIFNEGKLFDEEFGVIPSNNKSRVLVGALRNAINDTLPFNRFIALSRKACKLIKYQEDLKACDDIIVAIEMQQHHTDGTINYAISSDQMYFYDMGEGTLHSYFQDNKQIQRTTKIIQDLKVTDPKELIKI